MTFVVAALAGFATGWFIQFLNEATHDHGHADIQSHLDGCRPTKEDLVEWDRYTSGGRRG